PPVHRLQPVANIRQRPAHDYAHGVIQVRPLHFVFDIGRYEVLIAPCWGRTLRWLFLICQGISSLRLSTYFNKNLVASEERLPFDLSSPSFAVAGADGGIDRAGRPTPMTQLCP